MALLNPQQAAPTGTTVTFAAVGASDTVTPEPGLAVEFKNTGGGAGTVTLVVPGTQYGQARPDVSINVPATTGHVRVGGLVQDLADPTTGLVTFTYSGGTLTVAAVRY